MAPITAQSQHYPSVCRPNRFHRDIAYFTTRAVEELDRAAAATDEDARRAHDLLALSYLRAALHLHNGDPVRAVADRIADAGHSGPPAAEA